MRRSRPAAIRPTSQLKLVLSACVKLNDTACKTTRAREAGGLLPEARLLAGAAVHHDAGNREQSDANTLQIYPPDVEVDVLKNAEDYIEMAQLAMTRAPPARRSRCSKQGFEKNVFTDQRTKDTARGCWRTVKKKAADRPGRRCPRSPRKPTRPPPAPRTRASGSPTSATASTTRRPMNLNKAVTKGGVRNEAERSLLLGIAQLKAGNKDDAVKSLQGRQGRSEPRAPGEPLDCTHASSSLQARIGRSSHGDQGRRPHACGHAQDMTRKARRT